MGCSRQHKQALRPEEPSGHLAPRLRAGVLDQSISLGSEFGSCSGDVRDLKLNACLGTGTSAGHSEAPKQAFAASERGQRPKCFVPASL
jgi:hypothetical protein